MNFLSRIFGHAQSTVKGLLTGLGTGAAAGAVAAATQFSQTGNVTDWKPYAAAAVAATVPAIVGAFSEDPAAPTPLSESAQKAAAAIEQAGQDYAARKADEVIAKLQEQLAWE